MNTKTVRGSSKLVKRTSKFFGYFFALIYVFLFIPALIFIPPFGAFALDAEGVTTFGAMLCILGLAIIPLSMPFSIYFIYTRFRDAKYGKMFFFCFLPFLCSIFALLFVEVIICLYDHSLIPFFNK